MGHGGENQHRPPAFKNAQAGGLAGGLSLASAGGAQFPHFTNDALFMAYRLV